MMETVDKLHGSADDGLRSTMNKQQVIRQHE